MQSAAARREAPGNELFPKRCQASGRSSTCSAMLCPAHHGHVPEVLVHHEAHHVEHAAHDGRGRGPGGAVGMRAGRLWLPDAARVGAPLQKGRLLGRLHGTRGMHGQHACWHVAAQRGQSSRRPLGLPSSPPADLSGCRAGSAGSCSLAGRRRGAAHLCCGVTVSSTPAGVMISLTWVLLDCLPLTTTLFR